MIFLTPLGQSPVFRFDQGGTLRLSPPKKPSGNGVVPVATLFFY